MVVPSSTHSFIGKGKDASPSSGLREGLRDAAWRVQYIAIRGRQCTIVCDLHLRNLKSRDFAEVLCGIREEET